MKLATPPPTRRRRARHGPTLRVKLVAAPALIAGLLLAGSFSAMAQSAPSLMAPGDAVVTGFSGATAADNAEKRFIDLEGPSMQILTASGVRPVSDTEGGNPLAKFQVRAGQVGQVFGITLDDNTADGQRAPNIYLTATSLFGIQIVATGEDGEPARTTKGGPNASFMDGQFGLIEGAGPGTIYRVDGVSGEVTVFANVTLDGKANSGPGLGNIVFDPKSRQFFVTDLDTGMIHRIDAEGVPVDSFDHGVTGRTAAGLEPVEHDASARMNINDPAFNSEDPATWGLAAPDRRVIGVAVRDGRLYYSVNGTSPQIWSVGINDDGSFGKNARLEIETGVEDGSPMITDITFDDSGRIYLAQRGGIKSSFDYSAFTTSGKSAVLRYSRDPSGDGWSVDPQEYAIGMKPEHREAAGGVAIGKGPGGESCKMLWSTGDKLRPEQVIHGIQGNDLELVRPQNVPPENATYVDYDGKSNPEETEGHVGDVEVLRDCPTSRPELIPASSPMPVPFGGYLVPTHWKYGSDGHSKIRSHRKYGSWGHSKRRSHWKCASYSHWKRRSHRFPHLRRDGHGHGHGHGGHLKRRSHWKCFSHVHTKRRSHWKFASYSHTKRRSHWKFASRVHTKRRSHFKHASRDHSKRRSHWKFASRTHTKLRSHYKHASREHSKLRSHYKHASRDHSKRRSHWKTASRTHTKLRSHYKHASRGHLKRRSHNRRISRGVHHNRRISRGVHHSRRISRGVTHSRRISAGRIPKRTRNRFVTRRHRQVQRLHRLNRRPSFRTQSFRRGGFGGGIGRGGFRRR